jgi:hypothetical protein
VRGYEGYGEKSIREKEERRREVYLLSHFLFFLLLLSLLFTFLCFLLNKLERKQRKSK